MTSFLARYRSIWHFNRLWPLVLVGLFFVDLLLFGYVNYRVAPGLAQKERHFIELQSRARKAQEVNAATESPREAFRQAQQDLEKFNRRIPDRNGLSALVGEIFSIASRVGLDIRAIKYSPEKVKGRKLLEYPLTFAISGEYEQVKKFIHQVEQSPRLIAIDKISLRRDSQDEGRVKLSVSMITYFRLESA